jgi:hypothetical protein
MAPTSPLGPVQRALYGVLVHEAALVAKLAPSPTGGPGISDQPQPNARYPRLELGGFFAVAAPCYGPRSAAKWGWIVTGQVKALSTYPGEAQGQDLLADVVALLHFGSPALTVAGYADVECAVTLEPSYPETVNNVIVRHFPATVRVELHE